jgi:hypothetical protein
MQKLSLVFVAALSLAAFGCKKKGGGADCDKALDRSMELSKAELSKMPGVDDKMLGKMRDVGVTHCKDDKWSDDVRNCMVNAKTMADSQGCYGKLSQEQQDKMNKAAMELAAPPAPTGSAEVDTGSAAVAPDTGSAAGSAAGSAGSAAEGSAGSAAAGSAAAGSAGSAGSAAH